MGEVKSCRHCDDMGFCELYSNDAVVWKCKEDAECEGYVEEGNE